MSKRNLQQDGCVQNSEQCESGRERMDVLLVELEELVPGQPREELELWEEVCIEREMWQHLCFEQYGY